MNIAFEKALVAPKSSVVPKHGEIITWAEILPFTKSNCNTCYGKGYWTKLVGDEREELKQTCNCALKRFIGKWNDQVDFSEHGFVWKKESNEQEAPTTDSSD